MSSSQPARAEIDPVLATLEQAPYVEATETEVAALEAANAEGPWRTHDEILAALTQSAG